MVLEFYFSIKKILQKINSLKKFVENKCLKKSFVVEKIVHEKKIVFEQKKFLKNNMAKKFFWK